MSLNGWILVDRIHEVKCSYVGVHCLVSHLNVVCWCL